MKTEKQIRTYGPKPITYAGERAEITATAEFGDYFSITGTIRCLDKRRDPTLACGMIHDGIAKHFPELVPFLKWHLCDRNGPMHYAANVVYLAGDRDHWGLRKGEFRQHLSRGPHQAGGVAGVPCWELEMPSHEERQAYAAECPPPVTLQWKPYGRTGEGKARELDAARRAAIWPEATDEQLCAEPDELRAMLAARLPALLAEFRAAMETLGFRFTIPV